MEDLEYLRPFATTDKQITVLDAIKAAGGNKEQAYRDYNLDGGNARKAIRGLKKIAASRTITHGDERKEPIDEGFSVKGTSKLYDEAGNLKLQWVKTNVDQEHKIQKLIDAMSGAFEDYKGESLKTIQPKNLNKDLLTVYPMGDPHIGMYSWAEETGDDFDCDIAERDLCNAVKQLVERSPKSETAIILNLGDFFHSDTQENRTARGGNQLDVDSRWARVLHIGARAMIQCIYSALQKHKKVIVKNIIGNHDDHTSQALSLALSLYFENNKRVHVDVCPSKFWYYRFGKVLLGSTHGDTAKPEQLGGIMACDRAEDWGDTLFRYWFTGHIHTKNSMERPGWVWESFRTLAAKDAWHAGQGYRSGRDMVSIHLHKDYGEVERHTLNISMLRAN